MYKISKDKRKYSTTPIAIVDETTGKETQVLYSPLKKKEGDAFMEKIVELLNKNED